MRTRYTTVFYVLVISIMALRLTAQDVHFSQFYMTPLLLNPAQAGAQGDMRAVINYRNQWNSVASPFSTANVSWDMRIGKKKKKGFSAIGLNINQDKAGTPQLKTFQLGLNYAYHVRLNEKSTLGAGIYAGLVQRSISTTGIQWMNQYDGSAYNSALPSGEPVSGGSMMRGDLGGGLHYEYHKNEKYMTGNDHQNFSAGISAFHLNRPNYSFYGGGEKLYIKTVAYAQAELGLPNSNVSIVPGVMYANEGPSQEILAGTMIQYQLKAESKYTGYVHGSSLALGAYYRGRDAVVATMLLKLSQYAIGFSYDVNVSGLKTASSGRGGFEISLRFVNPNPFLYKNSSRL